MLVAGNRPQSPQVTDVLLKHFDLRAVAVTPLGGEHDQNAAVELADGSRVVVKVTAPGTAVRHIRWQPELMRLAGAEGALGHVRVPRVVPARNGDTAVAVEVEHDGQSRVVWVQSWMDGRMLAELGSHSVGLLTELGVLAAGMVRALAPAPRSPVPAGHHWDLLRVPEALAMGLTHVTEVDRLADVRQILSWYERTLEVHRESLPRAVVHHDLNDFNVLVGPGPGGGLTLHAVLDFADALYTARVGELAVAVAYAMLRTSNPLSAAAAVVRGYGSQAELTDGELAVLYPMAAARLCVNAVTWTRRIADHDHSYGRKRVEHTWPAVALLARTPPELAEAMFRDAAGAALVAAAPVRGVHPAVRGLDLRPFEPAHEARLPHGPARLGPHLRADAGTSARRSTTPVETPTLRLGMEIAAARPFPVRAPLAGTVESRTGSALPVLVLRHEGADGGTIWSRWTGLRSSLVAGSTVAPDDSIGQGSPERLAGLHVAVFRSRETALLATRSRVPASEAAGWAAVSPDPGEFLGLDGVVPPDPDADWNVGRVIATREVHFARSQRSYYRRPMNLVGGRGSWLYDEFGRSYLDAVNNVTHVGHGNPRVVQAAAAQLSRLNTNSRFVYPGIARYAERLTALLPGELEVAFLVCSGSEANDLAVRMARQVTGRSDVLVVDGAYHGSTSVMTGLSPNRYRGPGGTGPDVTTHEVEQPNGYRGRYPYGDPEAGAKYAADVARQVDRLVANGRPPAAFLAESVMGTAGSVFYPDGYLERAFAVVRSAGGLCIADEVQVGFGRLGDAFWGFATQGVTPDIVTMGKPMGNGYPMAAVVTTRAIADAFDSGMRYFNTFGGNPVACAIGSAVLDEIAEQGLQDHAQATGRHFKNLLMRLADKHELIGDVRGRGMYLGVELIRDASTKEPASAEALVVSELMKDEGVIVYPTGPAGNVLKIKPPLTFTAGDANLFTEVLDEVLGRDW